MKYFSVIRSAAADFVEDRATRLAAALAYYAAFSLVPLILLLIALAGLVWDPMDVQRLMESEASSILGEDGANQLKMMLSAADSEQASGWSSIVSIALLLFGATGLVGQLQGAINEIWEVRPDPQKVGLLMIVRKRLFSFGMICCLAFLLLISLAISSFVAAAGDAVANLLIEGASGVLLRVINVVGSFLAFTAVFAMMLKYLPDVKVRWRDVLFGASVTSLLFVLGKFAIGEYLGSRNLEATYGAAGSFALVMLWVYYTAAIFLFGAELTQAWARQFGPGIHPDKNAVRVVRTTVDKSS